MSPDPGRRPFFKYSNPETAISILESGNLRYSNPLDFNDPFDIQTNLHFDFDLSTLAEKVVDRLELYAHQELLPPLDEDDPWAKILQLVRSRVADFGFPKSALTALIGSQFDEITTQLENTRARFVEKWQTILLPSVRVFCVTEENDNLLMWAHYGRDHTGAVFELWSLPEIDNPLSVARKVQYSAKPPGFFSLEEFLDDLFTVRRLEPQELSRRYVCSKSDHWKYEQEWRVWYPLSKTDRYDDVPLRREELAAIYLGCKSRPDFRDRVIRLRDEKYPATKILQAKKHDYLYGVQYTAI